MVFPPAPGSSTRAGRGRAPARLLLALLCLGGDGAFADGAIDLQVPQGSVPVAPAVPPGAVVPSAPAASAPEGKGSGALRPLVWAVGGASLAAALVGGALLVDVAARFPALDEACRFGCAAGAVSPLQQRSSVGYALLVFGGVGLALDGLHLGLSLRADAGHAVALVPAPGGGAIAASF